MGRRVEQAEWDRRADLIGAEWLQPVTGSGTRTPIRHRECGGEWLVLPSNVTKQQGCPHCAKAVRAEKRRLPMGEWDTRAKALDCRWLAAVTSAQRPTRIGCRRCQHVWLAYPLNVTKGHGCPRCAGQVVTQEEWRVSFQEQCLTLLGTVANNQAKVEARCRCGHHWWVIPKDVRTSKQGCPQCGKVRTAASKVKRRTIAEINAQMAIEGRLLRFDPDFHADTDPVRVSVDNVRQRGHLICDVPTCCARRVGSGEPWKWEATIGSVISGQKAGCPACAESVPTFRLRYRDDSPTVSLRRWLADERDDIALAEDAEFAGMLSPCLFRCLRPQCGTEFEARSAHVIHQGTGCPTCGHSGGFSPGLPGRLYVIDLPEENIVKIGIMNIHTNRLDIHLGRGWNGPWACLDDDGAVIQRAEKIALFNLRADPRFRQVGKGVVPCDDGYTECFRMLGGVTAELAAAAARVAVADALAERHQKKWRDIQSGVAAGATPASERASLSVGNTFAQHPRDAPRF
jgi:hypothetical protein